MNWLQLLLAGVFEIGWPLGLKVAQNPENRWTGIAIAIAIVCIAISGTLLWLAQRAIPIGTAYAVWSGIGAAGTFLVGVLAFGDATSLLRYLGIVLIIAGVASAISGSSSFIRSKRLT